MKHFYKKFLSVVTFVAIIVLLGAIRFASPSARAATAFVQGKASTSGTTTASVTFTSNVTVGNIIAVGASWFSTSITLNSVTATCVTGNFTLPDNPIAYGTTGRAAQGYAVVSTSGFCTVTATFSGSVSAGIVAHEISGVNTASPLDGHAMQHQDSPGTGANAVTSGNITTTQNGDYIFGVANDASANSTVYTPGTGYTGRVTLVQWFQTEDKIQSSAGSVAATFTSNLGWDHPTTGVMAFKPSAAADTTPPSVPTGLAATAVSTSQINLAWTASTDNVGVTGYKIYRGGTQVGTSATTSYSDTGLTASTSYSYTVAAYDAAGNTSAQSASASAMTQAPADTTPPSVPANLSASAVSTSQINLSWTASTDNVGVTGYKIYRGGVQIGTTASLNYADTSLSPSTTYSYSVAAYDAAGNTSGQSASVSATTQSSVTPPPPFPPPPPPPSGTPWSGIIDPSRAVDWSQAGVPGGIPNRTTICATLNPGATAAQINSAIASCPAGQVVYLNAGTYTIASGISFNGHSNVTLRGAGPGQTILNFTAGDGCGGLGGDICAINSTGYYAGSAAVLPGGSNAHTWTAGYSQGTTQITLDSVSGLSVGDVIILDQANDTSVGSGLFVCDVASTCVSDGGGPGRTIGGVDYSQQQTVQITAINGSVLTISPGLYMNNWRSAQTPKMWWTGAQLTGVGIENLTVDNSASNAYSGIYFYNAYKSWVENVRSINGNRNHVWLYQSSRIVVRDSYFFGTHNAAEQSYGVEPWTTSDDLIENNIFDQIASPVVNGGEGGMVVGYNYTTANLYNVNPVWMQDTYISHDPGNAMGLFEGNELNAIGCDNIHGTSNLGTIFRNQLDGWQSGKTENTNPIMFQAYCRGYNLIGNVLGKPGYDTQYQVSPSAGSPSPCYTTIYSLGWTNVGCGTGARDDTVTQSSMMRWGNYDVVNAAAQWNSSEVPTTGVQFINGNPVPSNHNLPVSFYLSAKPFWWGSMPWPPIGPDVSGGGGPGGHSYSIPAQVCYNSTPKDSSGILNFNASNCYASASTSDTTPPSIPTGLAAAAISSSQINLSWTASTDNVGVAGYKIYRGGVQIGTSAGTSYSDAGLSPSTTYSYTVSAYDAAGNNSAQSASASATTQASSDTTSPSVPTGLTASAVSTSQINLAWTASTDPDSAVTGYKVFRNGTQVGTSTTNSYSDTGLSPSTTYSYTVSAYDAAGNNSAQSASVSATTQSSVTPPPPPPSSTNKFMIGDRIIVSSTGALARATPSLSGTLLQLHNAGELGTVAGGPQTADGYTWWNVTYDVGSSGWTTEPNIDKYAAPSAKFAIGDRVQTTAILNVRSTASTSGTLLGTQPQGALGTVAGGPISANGYTWWNITYANAPSGWSVENYLVKYGEPSAALPQCLELSSAIGTPAKTIYVYFDANAAMYSTTTKPAFCQ